MTTTGEELSEERLLLDALLGPAPVGLAFFDAELRCVRANAAFAALAAAEPATLIGLTPREGLPVDVGGRLEEVVAATLRSGRPRHEAELSGRSAADPRSSCHWLASAYAVGGGRARVGVVVTDVTQRKRVEKERRRLLLLAREERERAEQAELRSAFLARAGALLAESLESDRTLRAIAELAVPELAAWCFVEILQDDGSIQRLAMAAADPRHRAVMDDFDRRYPLDPEAPFGSPQVIRTGEPLLVEEMPDDALRAIAQDDEHYGILRSLGFGAVIIVPLRARGRILGDIAMTAGLGRTYDAEDLEMAQQLADRCALAVDNARLYAERG